MIHFLEKWQNLIQSFYSFASGWQQPLVVVNCWDPDLLLVTVVNGDYCEDQQRLTPSTEL